MFKSEVFDRAGADKMSRRTFYFIIGAVLAWGFVATGFVAGLTVTWQPTIWELLGLGLVLPLVGIFMSMSSNALVSFAGYHLVVIPFGAVLGPILAMYEVASPGIVEEAALLTAAVTAVMAGSGLLFPDFYRSIGGALFGALLCLVVVSLISLFVPALANFTLIHYIAAGIFALYIGFDMWRASTIPATLDNAVDVSISLYLDIINLFLRILQIMSKR